ncbi:MAG: hypothetical protein AAGE43_01120 [Pseudomonadota bacterium]
MVSQFRSTRARIQSFTLCGLLLLLSQSISAESARDPFSAELELGPTWQSRNDIQIPNDSEGDRFSLKDIAGSGPWAGARINLSWDVAGRHGMRAVLAPFGYEESGLLDQNVRFAGEDFQGGDAVDVDYRFNSWRLGYRYRALDRNNWRLWVGGTLKVRDAKIELTQEGRNAKDTDLGVVPLLYFAGEYRFNDRWHFAFDFDGLAGGPGRAVDLSLKLGYRLNENWRLNAGYRTLEGGADTDDIYAFAWFNTALFSIEYRPQRR